jgi:hypothetical protein
VARVAHLLTWFHTAPRRPRLDAGPQLPWRRVLPMALLGLLVAGLFSGAGAGLPDEFDATTPFYVGTGQGLGQELRERGVGLPDQLSETGYDGQWFLGQANDPLLRTDLHEDTFDAPRYRAVRGLFPAAGWLLAAGQPAATPYALLVAGMLAFALGSACSARIVSAYGRSPWWGLLFAAVPGSLFGVYYGTAEPLALALAMLGVTLTLDRRYLWAGVAFAGSALTKESYLAFAVGTALFLVVDAVVRGGTAKAAARGPRSWLRPAAAVVLPGAISLFAWYAYVHARIPYFPDPHGTFGRFSAPFEGWGRVLGTIARGDYPGAAVLHLPREAVIAASMAVIAAALVLALWLRQSLLAYLAFGWALFGAIIAEFLLERYTSANRTLAPSVLAAAVFLVTVHWRRARDQSREPGEPGEPGEPAVETVRA